MLTQARAELPNECCGLLAGRPVSAGEPCDAPAGPGQASPLVRVVRRYPLVNAAQSPKEYDADSRGMFEAFRDMRDQGLEHVAIYHSHPTSEPVPSRTDLERNFYGDSVIYFIISLKANKPELRGWWLALDYQEAEWEFCD
jgi:proteasome lid subunit RPN8/RPN11